VKLGYALSEKESDARARDPRCTLEPGIFQEHVFAMVEGDAWPVVSDKKVQGVVRARARNSARTPVLERVVDEIDNEVWKYVKGIQRLSIARAGEGHFLGTGMVGKILIHLIKKGGDRQQPILSPHLAVFKPGYYLCPFDNLIHSPMDPPEPWNKGCTALS
jgi:hypothetical protein